MTDRTTPRRRPARRSRTALLAAAVLASSLVATPAWAAPPATWTHPDNPGLAQALLTLGGWVVGIIAVIALLTYLPSMIRGSRGEGTLTFSEKSEWFGGPRTGVDHEADEPQGTGGASARW
jgi:hypothetical protein